MNVCVFCSSSNAISDEYFKAARGLGKLIGKRGHVLVNGGANVGLMETVTLAASSEYAKTIGIMPELMINRSLASGNSHEVIVTKDMMERKAKMREISDAFIALPGGFGTLEEILEVITLKQLSYHNKPVVFINVNGFFNDLFKQIERSYNEQFAKEVYKKLYFVTESIDEAMHYIENYKEVVLDSKWFVVPEK